MQPSLREPGATEVFISYRTTETSADAQLLYRLLESRNLNVFIDAAGIRAGDDWNDQITKALESPNLAVGIVLMSTEWYTNFLRSDAWKATIGNPVKDGVVVWEEVRRLRDRPGVTVMPVVIRAKKDGDVPPPLPGPSAPGYADLAKLDKQLHELNYTWIAPKILTRFDDLVGEVHASVRSSVLHRPVPGTSSTAEITAPLPLHQLATQPAKRLALLRYAEIISEMRHDHKAQTILGAEALLRKDFSTALQHFDTARAIAHTDGDGDEAFRSHLWHAQAHNLFVLASFRGGRPRRRQITEASDLLRNALLKAVAIETRHVATWPRGNDPQAHADRASAGYVIDLTLLLLWLLWVDFFLARNVSFPEGTSAELVVVERRLDVVRQGRAGLAAWGVGMTDAESDHRFLVTRGFLEGLPAGMGAEDAWTKAIGKGHIDKLLTGLKQEQEEEGGK